MTALQGKITDFGDLLHQERWIVKGKRLQLIWHSGAPVKALPEDRVVRGEPRQRIERTDVKMDLQADKKVTLSVEYTDEMGNPVDDPGDASVTFTVDDPAVISLTDNGDGTATAAAVGSLGTATVHAEGTVNGQTQSGDLSITVVAGLAERFNIEAGEPEEVTPDDAPQPL